MEKFVKILVGFGFWISFMLLCSFAEANKWGWALFFLIVFAVVCYIGNEFSKENEIDEEKELNFRDTIPAKFLENVMSLLIEETKNPTMKVFVFNQEELDVRNVYFAGRTLCIDVEDIDSDNEWEGVITITKDSCGWFDPYGYEEGERVSRSELTAIEKDMYIEFCKMNNIKIEEE